LDSVGLVPFSVGCCWFVGLLDSLFCSKLLKTEKIMIYPDLIKTEIYWRKAHLGDFSNGLKKSDPHCDVYYQKPYMIFEGDESKLLILTKTTDGKLLKKMIDLGRIYVMSTASETHREHGVPKYIQSNN